MNSVKKALRLIESAINEAHYDSLSGAHLELRDFRGRRQGQDTMGNPTGGSDAFYQAVEKAIKARVKSGQYDEYLEKGYVDTRADLVAANLKLLSLFIKAGKDAQDVINEYKEELFGNPDNYYVDEDGEEFAPEIDWDSQKAIASELNNEVGNPLANYYEYEFCVLMDVVQANPRLAEKTGASEGLRTALNLLIDTEGGVDRGFYGTDVETD